MRGSWAISRARPPRAYARRSARRIVIARLVAAGVIGLTAAVAAVGALVVARSPVTAFEWSVRPREVARVSSALVHTLAPPDPDGVVRRIPVRAGVVDRSVPAWGLALVAAAREAELDAIPVDRDGRALMTFAPLLPTLAFSDVWTAIEQGQRGQ